MKENICSNMKNQINATNKIRSQLVSINGKKLYNYVLFQTLNINSFFSQFILKKDYKKLIFHIFLYI